MVELPSGRWSWTVHARTGTIRGATVVFENRARWGEEMRSWSFSPEPTVDEIRELAREPLTRCWRDRSGEQWELSLELPDTRGRPAGRDGGAEQFWLVFRKSWIARAALIDGALRLGEMTSAQLNRLLEQAVDRR